MGKAARLAQREQRQQAEFHVFCRGVLEVLSIGKGDLKLTVDTSNPKETAEARRIIEEMLRKGYGIYVDTERGPIRVRQFNAETMTYMIVDEGAVTEAPDDDVAGAASNDEQLPPAKAKRAPRKAMREIPVAGSRATAVGRTAGG